jgi:hypothetical protein
MVAKEVLDVQSALLTEWVPPEASKNARAGSRVLATWQI